MDKIIASFQDYSPLNVIAFTTCHEECELFVNWLLDVEIECDDRHGKKKKGKKGKKSKCETNKWKVDDITVFVSYIDVSEIETFDSSEDYSSYIYSCIGKVLFDHVVVLGKDEEHLKLLSHMTDKALKFSMLTHIPCLQDEIESEMNEQIVSLNNIKNKILYKRHMFEKIVR